MITSNPRGNLLAFYKLPRRMTPRVFAVFFSEKGPQSLF